MLHDGITAGFDRNVLCDMGFGKPPTSNGRPACSSCDEMLNVTNAVSQGTGLESLWRDWYSEVVEGRRNVQRKACCTVVELPRGRGSKRFDVAYYVMPQKT
jgi:hypothetical protein